MSWKCIEELAHKFNEQSFIFSNTGKRPTSKDCQNSWVIQSKKEAQ